MKIKRIYRDFHEGEMRQHYESMMLTRAGWVKKGNVWVSPLVTEWREVEGVPDLLLAGRPRPPCGAVTAAS